METSEDHVCVTSLQIPRWMKTAWRSNLLCSMSIAKRYIILIVAQPAPLVPAAAVSTTVSHEPKT